MEENIKKWYNNIKQDNPEKIVEKRTFKHRAVFVQVVLVKTKGDILNSLSVSGGVNKLIKEDGSSPKQTETTASLMGRARPRITEMIS